MWFHRRKQEEAASRKFMEQMRETLDKLQKGNEEILNQQQTGAGAVSDLEKAVSGIKEQMEALKERQTEQERLIRRQSDSFEDLLEGIQEQREEKEYYIRERRDFQQKEQALIALIICCREQMGALRQQIEGDNFIEESKKWAWMQQFEVMNQEMVRLMRPCGLEEVGSVGELVDYDIHEILSVIDTESQEKANTVAQVYSRGLLAGGHVVKKAKVAAYSMANMNQSHSEIVQK